MDADADSKLGAPKKSVKMTADDFQARLLDALHLGADAFWQTDENGVIRQVLALGEKSSAGTINLLENKPLGDLLGALTPLRDPFREARAEVRAIGAAPVVMSLSGRRFSEGSWYGIARLTREDGFLLSDQQTRRVLDQLREGRDRELLLRRETETLLDGLRLLTGGQPSSEIFSILLDRLAPALEFQAAVILQRTWAGTVTVAAATTPVLKSCNIQDLGDHLLSLEDVAALFRVPEDIEIKIESGEPPAWRSGLAIRLNGGSKPTVLLCLREEPGFFVTRHLGLGTRLSLLASQAFQAAEEHQSVLEASKLAAIGEMAAGIVHEINQPLTVMMLGLSNLKDSLADGTCDAEQATAKLARLEAQAQRIAKIIASMRVLARRADGAMEPLAPRDAVLDALSIIGHKLTLAGIETVVEVPDKLRVYGDAGECTQVLINLLSNALDAIESCWSKATPGQPTGVITVTANAIDADWVELEVRDTGGGFPPGGIEKALLPFYTTKAAGKGTGLGLALCRRIIENMGGSITLANWDKGALVRLSLRRCAA